MSNTENIRTLNIVEEARKSALANIEQFQSAVTEASKINTRVIASSISKSQMETARAMLQPTIEAWQSFSKNNLFIQAIKRQQDRPPPSIWFTLTPVLYSKMICFIFSNSLAYDI